MSEYYVYFIQIKSDSEIINQYLEIPKVLESHKKVFIDALNSKISQLINEPMKLDNADKQRVSFDKKQFQFQFENAVFFHPDKSNNILTLSSKKVVIKA